MNEANLKIAGVVVAEEPIAVGEDGLDDAALLAHVRDHGHHVVLRGSDQGRAEHDGQVLDFHLVDVAVGDDFGQVPTDEPHGREVDVRQATHQTFQSFESSQRVVQFGNVDEGRVQILKCFFTALHFHSDGLST